MGVRLALLGLLCCTPVLLPRYTDFSTRTTLSDTINYWADHYKIPRKLLLAVAKVESSLNPSARSPKGAIGLFQVMPYHTTFCGLSSPASLYEPQNNTRCGAKILSDSLSRYSIPDSLRIYNGGPKCLSRRCSETENYVLKIERFFK